MKKKSERRSALQWRSENKGTEILQENAL